MMSPYANISQDDWPKVTDALLEAHPLKADFIVDVVHASWAAIFESQLAGKFRIGQDIFPQPQIMGFLLHELIPLELESRSPAEWRRNTAKVDKDLVYLSDPRFSVEIKTSSHKAQIFGNRSYAQPQTDKSRDKDGYYLAVNFGKFGAAGNPELSMIRFGWLDHTDWIAQKAATGQQARVDPVSDRTKLKRLYSKGN